MPSIRFFLFILCVNACDSYDYGDSQKVLHTAFDVANSTSSVISSVEPFTQYRNLRMEKTKHINQRKSIWGTYTLGKKELSPSDLGITFNDKTGQFTGAKFIEDPPENNLVLKQRVLNSYDRQESFSSEEYIDETLKVSGSASVEIFWMPLIQGSGTVVYEEIVKTSKTSIIIYQTGYKEYETEEISQNILQKEDNYKKASFIHAEAKENLKDFINTYGRYYVSKLTKGVFAVRKVTFNLDSEETKKYIYAQINAKIGIGFLSIVIPITYTRLSHEKRAKMSIEIEKESIGGNPNHLFVDFSNNFDNIEEKLKSSWNKFMNDPIHLGVLSVELSMMSRAIHHEYEMDIGNEVQLGRKIHESRLRLNEVQKQSILIQLNFDRTKSQIGTGGEEYLKQYRNMVNDFNRHLKKVKESFDTYLASENKVIMMTELPSKGTLPNSSVPHEINILEKKGDRWLQNLELTKAQMDRVFRQLNGSVLFATHLYYSNKEYPILWDGSVAYGKPAGIPNEILLYHDDEKVSEMTLNEKFQLQKFRISGDEWNVFENKPNEDAVMFANPSIDIEFDKLPPWVQNIRYKMQKKYDDPPRDYVGEWKRGLFFNGILTNTGHPENSFVSCQFTRASGDSLEDIKYEAKALIFADGSTYNGEVEYDHKNMTFVLHGKGKLNERHGCWRSGQTVSCS